MKLFAKVFRIVALASLVFTGACYAHGQTAISPPIVTPSITAQAIHLPGSTTGGNSAGCYASPVVGLGTGFTCPGISWNGYLGTNQGASDTTLTVDGTPSVSPIGCLYVSGEYECYTGTSTSGGNTVFTGLSRGLYTTGASTHNTGDFTFSVNAVFGSPGQFPTVVLTGNGLTINNPNPGLIGGGAVFSVNSLANQFFIDGAGGVHVQNISSLSDFQGSLLVGTIPDAPDITSTGNLLQINGPNTAQYPLTLGGGHAGTLNIIQTPTIPAPIVYTSVPTPGTTTITYVCSGVDFDGNLIPGTPYSVTNGAATWAYPTGYVVNCAWAAGVDYFQVWRTAGGPNQGLIGTEAGPGGAFQDYGQSATGGTPPTTSASNPHLAVHGIGNPTICMGSTGATCTTASITFASTAPSGSCISGSLWTNSSGTPNTLYDCESSVWVGK